MRKGLLGLLISLSLVQGVYAEPKRWNEVIQSKEFQGLTLDQQLEAQQQYFNEVVIPRAVDNGIPSNEIMTGVRKQFMETLPSQNLLNRLEAFISSIINKLSHLIMSESNYKITQILGTHTYLMETNNTLYYCHGESCKEVNND